MIPSSFLREIVWFYTRKNGHDDQPSSSQLIVANDRVAVVARFTYSAEAGPDRLCQHRSIQDCSRLVVFLALFRVDCQPRIYRLHDVIGADREAVIRRIVKIGRALRPLKPSAKAVEACEYSCLWPSSLRCLLDRDAGGIQCRRRDWGRNGFWRLVVAGIGIIRPSTRGSSAR